MSSSTISDGVFCTKLVETAHENKVHGVLTQPSEQLILDRNAELRKNPGTLKDLSFGRQVASIPMIVYNEWRTKYPKLRSSSTKDRSEELMRVLRLPENKIYRVTEERI